jgi:hypothetical protein
VHISTRLALLLAAFVSLPAVLAAQDISPLGSARIRDILRRPPSPPPGTAGAVPPSLAAVNCDRYVLTPKIAPTNEQSTLREVTACLEEVNSVLKELAGKAPSATSNQEIIRARINYKRLKKWIPSRRRVTTPDAPAMEWLNARKAELEVGQQLPITLKKHDLFATFSAILIGGATLVDANQPEGEEDTAPSSTGERAMATDAEQGTEALGTIVWQSRHFGDESIGTFDFSIGGRIGVQPVLNLVTATPAADAAQGAPPDINAVHQHAFVWTAGVQAQHPYRGINSELGWYGALGSSTLSSLPKAVDKGQGSFIAFPLDYGAQKTAWLWETGFTFNLFDNPLEQIHAEKGTTTPQFQALVALRRDERFRGRLFDDYRRPESRLVFRLTLDAIRVFDRRQFGEPTQPFTFGFVVEHERSLATSGLRVPSATRFVLRGDVNLLRALNGMSAEAQSEDTVTPVTHTWTIAPPAIAALPIATDATSVTIVVAEVTVGSSSVKTTPAPTLTVSLAKAEGIAIPACPGATVQFALTAGTLTATPVGWSSCTGTLTVQVSEGGSD